MYFFVKLRVVTLIVQERGICYVHLWYGAHSFHRELLEDNKKMLANRSPKPSL